MTLTIAERTASTHVIRAVLPEPFSPRWSRLAGITVDGNVLSIDAARYFLRYENPTWMVCDWNAVCCDLLEAAETPDVALEQRVVDYVKAHGRRTSDPAEVLAVAWRVYEYLFRDEQLSDPGLSHVDPRHLCILREMGTMMALNRVELTGEISNVGPAWFFPVTAQVVYDLTDAETAQLDELYHGGFFNENGRAESIKAHAALGGRLVHGCQSAPDMSGGCVVPYGTDIARFRDELNGFKHDWMDTIRAQRC